ncbi:hypothetical protein [Kitasatospora sp. NPDC015120]|uniref:hypothetical protein n=1 Tax=Kitasatospora sp. NPDC015120 TaxID=3364023 RepID=UPI0036F48332
MPAAPPGEQLPDTGPPPDSLNAREQPVVHPCALGPGAARALGPQPRPQGRQQPSWAPAPPAAVPDHPARPDALQPAPRPAEQAADAIAALRHLRTPAVVLESALHLAQATTPRRSATPGSR